MDMPILDHDYFKYYCPEKNDVWLDLGATIGEVCMIHKQEILDKNIFVVCVEPNPIMYRELVTWCFENIPQNVLLINAGIWSKDTYDRFNITSNIWCNMFDIHGYDVSKYGVNLLNINCPMLSLNTILDIIGKKINFLKADIEGAEIEVFNNFEHYEMIDRISVAAYHPYNNSESYEYIKPKLGTKYKNIIIESIPYNGFPPYTMLYGSN